MDKLKAALFVLLAFVVLPLAKSFVAVSPSSVDILEGDEFSVNVSFSTNVSDNVSLVANYDNNSLFWISPGDVIDFGMGGFSGMLEYKFLALNSGKTKINFTINGETAEMNVNVIPKYVNFSVPDKVTVEKGDNFTVGFSVDAMNAYNITLNTYTSSGILKSSNTFLGSGSFKKNLSLNFTAEDTTNGIESITFEVCSSLGCENKTTEVYVKDLELNVSSESPSVSANGKLVFDVSMISFNFNNTNLKVLYDKNWFDMVSNLSFNGGTLSDKLVFRMRNDSIGCPNTTFVFVLHGDNEKVTKKIFVDVNPYTAVSLNPSGNVVNQDGNLTVNLHAIALGIKNTSFAFVYSKKEFELLSASFSYETYYLKSKNGVSTFSSKKPIIFPISNYVALLGKPNDSCINFEGNVTLKPVESGNLTLFFALVKDKNPIANSSVNIISTSYSSSTTSSFCAPTLLSVKGRPCIPQPTVCPPGFVKIYNKCISENVTMVCPNNAVYNETTKRCEIHPEVQVICDKGEYNPSTDKCEYYPEISMSCQGGNYIPPDSNQFQASFDKHVTKGAVLGGFNVIDVEKHKHKYTANLYLPYNFTEGSVYKFSLNVSKKKNNESYTSTFNFTGEVEHELSDYALVINESGVYLYVAFDKKDEVNISLNLTKGIGVCSLEPNIVCSEGVYDAENGTCEVIPNVTISCPAGIYNESTGTCQYSPPVENICDVGEYNPASGACEVEPSVEYVCNVGSYNASLRSCVYTPNMTVLCDKGEFNSSLNACVYTPNVSVVCEQGEYDSDKDLCVYKPNLSVIDTITLYAEVEEPVSISIGVDNPTNGTISGISSSISPSGGYEVVSHQIGSTELSPGNSTEVTYVLKFNESGEHNLTLNVSDDNGSYVLKKYQFEVEPKSSISGFAILGSKSSSLALLLIILLALSYILFMRMKY